MPEPHGTPGPRWRTALPVLLVGTALTVTGLVLTREEPSEPSRWQAPPGYQVLPAPVLVDPDGQVFLWVGGGDCWLLERREDDPSGSSSVGACGQLEDESSIGTDTLGVIVGRLGRTAAAATSVDVSADGVRIGTYPARQGTFALPADAVPAAVRTVTLQPQGPEGRPVGAPATAEVPRPLHSPS